MIIPVHYFIRQILMFRTARSAAMRFHHTVSAGGWLNLSRHWKNSLTAFWQTICRMVFLSFETSHALCNTVRACYCRTCRGFHASVRTAGSPAEIPATFPHRFFPLAEMLSGQLTVQSTIPSASLYLIPSFLHFFKLLRQLFSVLCPAFPESLFGFTR